ncbi:leucyl aminopeptidase family protein [Paenibacillus mendelii]|uniref:Probable cytosol aminopeptidase n=1 Tax=Paenibacillus mendelii TaxID=206163 RepID=A0ABV6J8C1_9BACL|nr:leucyl aminopeptidase family protein [Paenibacillus mendelii]MCQ6559466.1 leucyl aminopeptidase family protein [Paenibacillus mendelii]
MKIEAGWLAEAQVIIVPLFKESLDNAGSYPGPALELLNRYEIRPSMVEKNAVTWLFGERGKPDTLLLGLGEAQAYHPERIREAAGTAGRAVRKEGRSTANVSFAALQPYGGYAGGTSLAGLAAAWTEGWLLGSYEYDAYKSKSVPRIETDVYLNEEVGGDPLASAIQLGRIRAEGTLLARELANEPPSVLYPASLASRVKERFSGTAVEVKVYEGEELERLQMAGLLAVGRGSKHAPAFLELRYQTDDSLPLIALVGKGITFDTGGISLKRDNNISDMRMDMAGGAAVIGALDMIARSGMKANVAVLIPAAENAIGKDALLPGEILRYANGVSVQVGNTDAEGRLVLADALIHAKRIGAHEVIDMATLTYSVVGALGSRIAGIWGDEALARTLCEIGSSVGEKLWIMPLAEEYVTYLDSDCADSSNISRVGEAGAIVAALFLRKFVDPSMRWAHIDMAGLKESSSARGYIVPGATGFGARLLAGLVAERMNHGDFGV